MRRAKMVAHKTPSLKICKIYQNLIKILLEKYPQVLNFMNYEETPCSKYFKQSFIPSFEDLERYFIERKKFMEEKGLEENISCQQIHENPGKNSKKLKNKLELGSLAYCFKNKIHASVLLNRQELDKTLAEIFNYYNGVFPNLYRVLLFFPALLQNQWKSFKEIIIEDGPLETEFILIVGIMVIFFCKSRFAL